MNTKNEKWDVRFDMHFHSTRSDGHNTPDEILDVAQESWLQLITLLDHDIVSSQNFIDWAKKRWIDSLYSSELSVRKRNGKGSMHFWYYSTDASEKVETILEKTREGSVMMLEAQIEKLQSIWFDLTVEDFYVFLGNQGQNKYSWNKYILATFLFQKPYNQQIAENILWRKTNVLDFYLSKLKARDSTDMNVSIPEYEPSLEVLSEIAEYKNTLISIAHPNFTFQGWIKDFEKKAPGLIELWVGAIEINTKATPDWIDSINKICREFGILRTMWSDNHKIWFSDNKHGNFWELNPYICNEEKKQILDDFKDYFTEL